MVKPAMVNMGTEMKESQDRVRHGILLAGGESRRMMRDKALLEIRGQTLLQRQSELLARFCDQVWLSRPVNDLIPELNQTLRLRQERKATFHWVKDEIPGRGPLEGIRSCLLAIEKASRETNCRSDQDAVLVLPVDMPYMSDSALLQLIQASATTTAETVHYLDFEMPLLLKISDRLLNVLERLLSSPDRKQWSVQAFLRNSQNHVVNFDHSDPELTRAMMNTNNPGEWHAALLATDDTA